MSNVLSEGKKQQVIALGRLGWSLRRIQTSTGARRETAGSYLRSAGIAVRPPSRWGRQPPAKPANEVITDPAAVKPGDDVDSEAQGGKPANEVITDFGAEPGIALPTESAPQPGRSLSASACTPFRELIEVGLSRGRNTMAISGLGGHLRLHGRIPEH